MNYFLFSGIPGIINIFWIIVQYCPILSNSCQIIHFYFIHLAFLSLIAFEGGFWISFNPQNAFFSLLLYYPYPLYFSAPSLPILYYPILYSAYILPSYPLLPLFSNIRYSPYPPLTLLFSLLLRSPFQIPSPSPILYSPSFTPLFFIPPILNSPCYLLLYIYFPYSLPLPYPRNFRMK